MDSADIVMLILLVVLLAVLYKVVIPFLFPSVVHGVSVIKMKDSESSEVYAFQGGKVPFLNTEKRSHAKAVKRRKNNVYNAVGV